ncbi:(glcNAc)2 ABC transporter [Vibrio sp. JCM 19236]|nr:(glcNAc)2 ABC transporter [Vibrio sp. JCM 19236]
MWQIYRCILIDALHKPPAFITGGEVLFNGENILKYSDDRMQGFRWSQMSMVFQSAMNALNPVLTMEEQFCDVIMRHTNMTRAQAKLRAEGLLEIVDIHPSRLSDYPHQFLVVCVSVWLSPSLSRSIQR